MLQGRLCYSEKSGGRRQSEAFGVREAQLGEPGKNRLECLACDIRASITASRSTQLSSSSVWTLLWTIEFLAERRLFAVKKRISIGGARPMKNRNRA